jgi:hypothetical protein
VEEHKDTAAPQLKASCSMPVGDDDGRYLGEVKTRPKDMAANAEKARRDHDQAGRARGRAAR